MLRFEGVIPTPLQVQGNNETLPSITYNTAFTPALQIREKKNLKALEDLMLIRGLEKVQAQDT